ncbi:hypothetical protein ACNH6C_13870 [Bdellovibrio bacteriovorus]|uniref:hypothetical protein n=1 Tax=Bdellovibrio bacteriovorus TaxID=959 RepID=UPI003A7FA5FA
MKTLLAAILLFGTSAVAQKKNNESSSGGRFQIIQLSDFRRDQYLIDTQTGKMWQKSCLIAGPDNTECAYGPWLTVDIENVTMDYGAIDKKAKTLKKMMEESSK